MAYWSLRGELWVSAPALGILNLCRTPAIIIFLLSYFISFVHFGCIIGGRIYYNMDHLYFCIYLFITEPQPQSSYITLFACRILYVVMHFVLLYQKSTNLFCIFILLDTYNQSFTKCGIKNLVLLENKRKRNRAIFSQLY